MRLRATTEAGGRGPFVSAAELNLYGPPGGAAPVTDPGTRGVWGPVIGLPIVPTTAILLPGDKVLTMSAAYNTTFTIDDPPNDRTQISIIDVSQGDGGRPGQREVRDTQHQMFCTGLSILADGRVLITGGSSSKTTTIYDPVADTFTRAPDMVVPRGYQTSVTLSDGTVFAIGGSWSGGEHDQGVLKDGELMAADASAWRSLPGTKADAILTDDGEGAYRADNHAWLFADTGGRVFHAGPSDQMNWFDTAGTGTTVPAGERGDAADEMNGNAVMYAEDRILTLGGAPGLRLQRRHRPGAHHRHQRRLPGAAGRGAHGIDGGVTGLRQQRRAARRVRAGDRRSELRRAVHRHHRPPERRALGPGDGSLPDAGLRGRAADLPLVLAAPAGRARAQRRGRPAAQQRGQPPRRADPHAAQPARGRRVAARAAPDDQPRADARWPPARRCGSPPTGRSRRGR